MQWLNEPPQWREDAGTLSVRTGERTDFWRTTHYGFIRDDGHLRFAAARGDFTATLEFSGAYRELYDQAGMMVRIDAENWLKAGIEYVDGRQMLSVVATRSFSDWSTAPGPEGAEWIGLRVTRHGGALRVDWAVPGEPYAMMRLAHLPEAAEVMVGPVCCSPQRAGFEATFRGFSVGAPIARDLHAGA